MNHNQCYQEIVMVVHSLNNSRIELEWQKKCEKLYCPDGTTHLVDEENKFLIKEQNIDSKKILLNQ